MSNINRHNYETFFLLYTDNELSVEAKKAVEEFVEVNPDLQDELMMLQQSILKPDDIVYDGKVSLLKNVSMPAGIQERLLLLLDNELTATEETELSGLINTSAGVKQEWETLQQTKLLRDTIIFQDKQSLYRRETGRLIAFPWKQVAAAAVLIAFGIWGGSIYFSSRDNKKGDPGVVKNIQSAKSANSIIKPVVPPVEIKVPLESPLGEQEQAIARAAENIEKYVTSKKPTLLAGKVEPHRSIKEAKQSAVVFEKSNNLPRPYSDNLNKIGSNETVPAYVTIQQQPGDMEDTGKNATEKNTGNQEPAKLYASYRPDNGEDINNDRVFFMDEEKIKKTKLGGIFRKVKRVLERKANIKPGGNNIKVANLEFAIQ